MYIYIRPVFTYNIFRSPKFILRTSRRGSTSRPSDYLAPQVNSAETGALGNAINLLTRSAVSSIFLFSFIRVPLLSSAIIYIYYMYTTTTDKSWPHKTRIRRIVILLYHYIVHITIICITHRRANIRKTIDLSSVFLLFLFYFFFCVHVYHVWQKRECKFIHETCTW